MVNAEKTKKIALKSFMKNIYKVIRKSATEGLFAVSVMVPKDIDLFFEEQMDKRSFIWRRKYFYSDKIEYKIIWS